MKIFFSEQMPTKTGWIKEENWAVLIEGKNYFGAKSKEDLERAAGMQNTRVYKKKKIYVD